MSLFVFSACLVYCPALFVCVLCSFCYEPVGCWVSKLINNYYYYYYYYYYYHHHHHHNHLVEGGTNYEASEITSTLSPSGITSKSHNHIMWHSKLRSQCVGGNIDRNKHLTKESIKQASKQANIQSINHHCQSDSAS